MLIAVITRCGAMILSFLLPLVACTEETKVDVASSIHPEKMPTMLTRNVSTMISDSGIVQYKIVSPLWKVYDEIDTPRWEFPAGLYLQKYDRNFKVIGSLAADSATYYKDAKLWRLDGHVEMRKQPGDLFLSERIFWDQRKKQIYSDTFIHIENDKHVLEGTGFISNESLTVYRVLKPQGIFPVKKEDISGNPDQADPMSPQPQPVQSAPPTQVDMEPAQQ